MKYFLVFDIEIFFIYDEQIISDLEYHSVIKIDGLSMLTKRDEKLEC